MTGTRKDPNAALRRQLQARADALADVLHFTEKDILEVRKITCQSRGLVASERRWVVSPTPRAPRAPRARGRRQAHVARSSSSADPGSARIPVLASGCGRGMARFYGAG